MPSARPIPPPGDQKAPQAEPDSLTFAPVADTYTAETDPWSTSGGTSAVLRADSTRQDTAFLRFDLASLEGKNVKSAQLRVHSTDVPWAPSVATFDVKLVTSTDWKEAWMSSRNSVPVSGTVLGTLPVPNQPNIWYTIDLAKDALQATAGSALSVAVTGRSGDVLIFYSREAGAALAPQLIVTYD
jgi:hypothetical protein